MSKSKFFRSRANHRVSRRLAQRGATLIVGLIMLVLITLIVINAFTMSSTNLKSVGNMQVRGEAIAAANQAIERVIDSSFTNALGSQNIGVDINKDGVDDYTVAVATPVCLRAIQGTSASAPSGSETGGSLTGSADWTTEWDISATVTDVASGASVTVREGVRVLLSLAQKNIACP